MGFFVYLTNYVIIAIIYHVSFIYKKYFFNNEQNMIKGWNISNNTREVTQLCVLGLYKWHGTTKEPVDELKVPLLSFFIPVSILTIGSKPLVLMKSFKGCLVQDGIPFPGGNVIKKNKSVLASKRRVNYIYTSKCSKVLTWIQVLFDHPLELFCLFMLFY